MGNKKHQYFELLTLKFEKAARSTGAVAGFVKVSFSFLPIIVSTSLETLKW